MVIKSLFGLLFGSIY